MLFQKCDYILEKRRFELARVQYLCHAPDWNSKKLMFHQLEKTMCPRKVKPLSVVLEHDDRFLVYFDNTDPHASSSCYAIW